MNFQWKASAKKRKLTSPHVLQTTPALAVAFADESAPARPPSAADVAEAVRLKEEGTVLAEKEQWAPALKSWDKVRGP